MNERRKNLLASFRKHEDLIDQRLRYTIETHRKGKAVFHVVDRNGVPVKNAKICAVQTDHDFKLGANCFMLDEFECEEKNEIYKTTFAETFNLATIPFYWSDLEPEIGRPRFAKDSPKIYRRPAPDLCLEYCEENGITPKCHCLNYDVWTPLWVPDDIDSVKYYLEKRIAECAERYRHRIPGWEVTNELYCGKYDTYSQNRKSTQFFTDRNVVEWSFMTARKYLPNNELIINEADHCWTGLFKYQRGPYYTQIERALEKGAPIDAVGMQFHRFVRKEHEIESSRPFYDPIHLYEVMDTYGKLGLPQQITEITIPCYSDNPDDEQLQAEILEYLLKIWFSNPLMEAVIYWNLTDGYAAFAPIGDMTAGENYYYGGLMRHDMTPKPAVAMLQRYMKQEWHTDAEFTCDDGGWGVFKGFYGWYDVTVEADGVRHTERIHVTRKSGNRFHIVV